MSTREWIGTEQYHRRSGDPPRLCREGKLELTTAPRSKTVATRIPEGFPPGRVRKGRSERCGSDVPIHSHVSVPPHHPASFRFNNSFTFPGLAFPPEAFRTCPTKKPSTCSLPLRY